MRKFIAAVAIGSMLATPTMTVAGTKDFALQGYALPVDKPVSIVLMRPDVDIGELQGGGLPEPNADWTEAARKHVTASLKANLEGRSIRFSTIDDQLAAYNSRISADDAAAAAVLATCMNAAAVVPVVTDLQPAGAPVVEASVPAPAPVDMCQEEKAKHAASQASLAKAAGASDILADYEALHGAVVGAIVTHKYGLGGGKLPTKKEGFDYTMGPGTSQVAEISGSNYGLFVTTYDQFASDSRKALQVVGMLGCIIGACVIVSGGQHVAYVSLVELDSGNVVWFNLLRGSKGDVREADGAKSMVDAILAGMPTKPGERTAETSDGEKG